MRSKIKAKLIVKKCAQSKAGTAPESTAIWEEASELESEVISMIRGFPREKPGVYFLAEDVRKAGKTADIEHLKVLRCYVQYAADPSSTRTFFIDYVEELEETLASMGVTERHQYFSGESMSAVMDFMEEVSFELPMVTARKMNAHVLMNPKLASVFEQLAKKRKLTLWSEIEPLLNETAGNPLALSEGVL